MFARVCTYRVKILVCGVLVSCYLYLYTLTGPDLVEVNNYGENRDLRLSKHRHADDKDIKYILFWNEWFGNKEFEFGFGRSPFYENLCPDTKCYTTENRSLKHVEEFDAIVFHHRSLDWSDIPARRLPKQRYIFFYMESPSWRQFDKINDLTTLDNFFNWTMTYRKDSDFPRPYGRVLQIKEHPADRKDLDQLIQRFGQEHQAVAAGKSKMAAWFVSNCVSKSHRENYVASLQRFINVDIYGECGPLKCPRKEKDTCYSYLDTDYRFYLSFENSICRDYITEKFFHIAKHNIIPVVLNGVDMARFAPPHSYIDVRDFDSPELLSKYIMQVSKDPALYASYFWWKDFYQVRAEPGDLSQAFCSLCSALHRDSSVKVYSDLHGWWVKLANCTEL